MEPAVETKENDEESLKLVVVDLENELTTVKADLESVQKKLTRVERLYEKSMTCNEVLRQKVEELSGQLQEYQKAKANRVDALVQVNELELTANTSKCGPDVEVVPADWSTPPPSEPNTSRCGSDGEALVADWVTPPPSEPNTSRCGPDGEALPADWGATHTPGASTSEGCPDGEAIPADWTSTSTTTELQGEADKPMSTTSIADMVKAAAEEALENSGVVYHAESGMYYDYNTGYYHDPERSLFYEPCSGTYYYYDQATQQYVFHSQIDVSQYSTSANSSHGDKPADKAATQEPRNVSRKQKSKEKRSSRRKEASQDCRKKKRKKEKSETSDHKHNRKKEKECKHRHKHKRLRNSEKPVKDHETNESSKIDIVDRKEVDLDGVPMDTTDTVVTLPDSAEKKAETEVSMTTPPDDGAVEGADLSGEEEHEEMSCTEGSSDLEEGELSSSSEEESDTASSGSSEHTSVEEEDGQHDTADNIVDNSEDPRMYPPSIRAMVTASSCLDVGTLFLVTYLGATVGREKSLNHAILIPDLQVSKMHAEIRYHDDLQKYTIQDHASQNGSLLNGKRLGEPKKMSAHYPLTNGDVLTLGDTTLSLHIHPGVETCDDCEPGIVKARLELEMKQAHSINTSTKAERESERRKNLKDIKKKYGLKNMDYESNSGVKTNPAYKDKASERRRKVGSDVEQQKASAPASVNVAIPEENKGHAMLRKMGWKSGEGLGREQEGITEPVSVHLRPLQSAGLGSASNMVHSLDDAEGVKKTQKWLKAQQRFQDLPSSATTSTTE